MGQISSILTSYLTAPAFRHLVFQRRIHLESRKILPATRLLCASPRVLGRRPVGSGKVWLYSSWNGQVCRPEKFESAAISRWFYQYCHHHHHHHHHHHQQHHGPIRTTCETVEIAFRLPRVSVVLSLYCQF